MSIGKLVAKLWLFLCIQDGRRLPMWILVSGFYCYAA